MRDHFGTSIRRASTSHAFKRAMARLLLVAAIVAGVADVLPARAQQETPKYEVTGFRDARFGMTEAEVRAIVTKAFNLKPADITGGVNSVEGTNVITVNLPSLDPGPGAARVAYIFGNKSKKLIQVNVIWGEVASTPAIDPNAMIAAGSRIERYFAGFAWKKETLRSGIPVGENTIVLFAGEDEKKGAVRLIADGVKYQMQREGNQTTSPDPKGPPKLIINYIAERDDPDIARIERGKF
ncbi:MAG: hypothetical protein V4477_08265 [Pseudomonadota bacterium]